MYTDYKIKRIVDNGVSIKVTVAFYEGDISTQDEDSGDSPVPVKRYRRSGKLREETYKFKPRPNMAFIKGQLNAALAQDHVRTSIPGQN